MKVPLTHHCVSDSESLEPWSGYLDSQSIDSWLPRMGKPLLCRHNEGHNQQNQGGAELEGPPIRSPGRQGKSDSECIRAGMGDQRGFIWPGQGVSTVFFSLGVVLVY